MVQCTPAPGGASFNDCCPSCRITSPHVRFVFIACDGQETGLVLFALNPISGLGGHCEHTAVHRCLCVSAPVPAPHCSYIPVAIKKLKVPVGDLDPDATADFSNEVGFGVGVYPLDSDHQRPRYDGKSMLYQFFSFCFCRTGHDLMFASFSTGVIHAIHQALQFAVLLRCSHRQGRFCVHGETRVDATQKKKLVLLSHISDEIDLDEFTQSPLTHHGLCYQVTELMTEGSLRKVLHNKNKRLPWQMRLTFALDIATGMQCEFVETA
jgi:hypothetical protein